jgi:putative hydrolase of the HAD superfamily
MKIDTLLFDLDNTLIDRNQAMRATMRKWLGEQAYLKNAGQMVPGDGAQATIEKDLEDIMKQDRWGYADRLDFCSYLLHHHAAEATKERTAGQLFETIRQNIVCEIRPDPAILHLLQQVSRSFRLVLATNGHGLIQRAKLSQAGLQSFFQPGHIFISGEMGFDKPDKRFFIKILTDLTIAAAQAIMIGDHPVNDIEGARSCGLSTCWVSHGRQAGFGNRADRFIPKITAISNWLNY